MLEYFKNIANKNSCSVGAVCSIHPAVNSLNEIILEEISEISLYAVKLNELGFVNSGAYEFLIEALSVFLINTSFNQNKYLSLIFKLDSTRLRAREKYLFYCEENNLPYEIVNKNLKIDENTTISRLIEYSEEYIMLRQKKIPSEKLKLFELIILMAKLTAINILKIKKLEHDNSYDFAVLKFFSVINLYSLKIEKIKKRILEFSSLALAVKNRLIQLQNEKFGQKETSSVNLSLEEGYGILVSGDDVDELDKVLNSVEKYKNNGQINVYTNGALFLANLYPYFKNNKFLKGHFGTDNAEYDFSNFNGSILITQNFVQKIDNLYKGEVFSKKIISFAKVADIENDDYFPLIDACLRLNKAEKQKSKNILINYDKNKFNNIFNEEIILIIGRLNTAIQKNKNLNKKIMFLNSAIEGEILLEKIDKLIKNNIKLTIFFSECSLVNLDLLFVLLNYDVDIYFVNCSNTLINPRVTEALSENFNVKII